jgi:LCP family protein required for cell wall assembly
MSTDESRGRAPVANAGKRPALTRRQRIARRVIVGFGVFALVVGLAVGGGLWWLTERYAGNVDRITDVFAEIPEESRPEPARPVRAEADDPVTFLLVGSDSREVAADGEAPGARSDAIMLARVEADREHAQVISIPRDSWVDIPGHGMNKINASYAFGGPSLLIRTVEQLTGVRIDHFVAIDFAGLAEVTEALGGVDVYVAETTTNGDHTFTQGMNHITGEEARWYLGQRYGLPGGDFDRVKRQQQFLKAIMDQLISSETFGDLGRLDRTLRAVTGSVAVDDELGDAELLSLAYSMRNVTRDGVAYFTAPVDGTGQEGSASVVYLNEADSNRMWGYLTTDSLGANVGEFGDHALGAAPR